MVAPEKTKNGYHVQSQHLTSSVRAGLAVEQACSQTAVPTRTLLKQAADEFDVSYESVRDAMRIKRDHTSRFSEILLGQTQIGTLMKELCWN